MYHPLSYPFRSLTITHISIVGVNDTVVNQLLSKIDGVDQLNNILVIGMTNRYTFNYSIVFFFE